MMGIKRKIEENGEENEKKTKMDEKFSVEIFAKNLKDPESNFLALSELNEHVRHVSSETKLDELLDNLIEHLESNLDPILVLISEEKRKASENITLYRFLTTLLEYFSRKNHSNLSELILKKFISITSSIHTVYFMLSSHSTASHLKITLRFLLSMVQQNEYTTRLIFGLIDFKRPCWKSLLKRRDIRDIEDVRFWMIKFFFSPLIYQNIDTIRNLIKEHDIFHEIFSGLFYDSRRTVEIILDEIRTNIIMLPGMTKTDKVHLFDDRNLKSLIRLYNWSGQQKQKTKKDKVEEVMEVEETIEREEVRKIVHTFLMIIFNSKNYGINFFDPQFGSSTKNANPILFKVITHLSNHFLIDEYAANLIITCLTTCPDLLQPFFKLISHEYISLRSKNLLETFQFLCEVFEQQKPLNTWLEIFQNITDPIKLTDIFINLTLPMEIMTKFDQIILKTTDSSIQLVAMKFLSMVLERVKDALNILTNTSFACNQMNTIEAYQQAILRFIPKPDYFCESLTNINEYLNLLKVYSSSCFMSMSAMNINLDSLLSNSLLYLLGRLKDNLILNENFIENYFQCLRNILHYRESIDDVIWARYNKELKSTPIRMLFQLARHLTNFDQSSNHLASIIVKFSSMIHKHHSELIIWFYTWLKLGSDPKIEHLLSNAIERMILNPYPILEKTPDNSEYSLMIYSVFEQAKEEISNEIDEYLCHVVFQIYLRQINPSSHEHLQELYLNDKRVSKIWQLFSTLSSSLDHQNPILTNEIESIEQRILSNIDLHKGPDTIQIHLAIQLNIFKLFALNITEESQSSRLISEMIQCLNIVLLRHDPHRSFENLFDSTIEYMQNYSSTIENSLICRLIDGLNIDHQCLQPLQHSKILLRCLEIEPNNSRLVRFIANYLSEEYRLEFLNLICQTVTNDREISKILIKELREHEEIGNERFLDAVIDGLNGEEEEIDEGIECVLELIERMKRMANEKWKNVFRLKQKMIFKLTKKNYSQIRTRILVAKVIVRTIIALRSHDRPLAIDRLVHKSHHSLLLHAHIFHDLLNLDQSIESDEFQSYLQLLLEKHSAETIVFDLLRVYNQSEKILVLLQNEPPIENPPIQQTNQLLLILKLFPEATTIVETIYKSLIKKSTNLDRSSLILDDWFHSFEQCTTHLLTSHQTPIDLYDLINHLLTYSTNNSTNLLKALIQLFLTQEPIDHKHLAKFFANFLKHPQFLSQLSSSNRSTLVDILSLFVTHYHSPQFSITIDCSKHFPMLLSIYNPTLSNNDQHTLACMYAYEKKGYSMQSAFVWGEAALKLYSTTTDTKSVLLQASKLDEVMSLLDDRMMRKSILWYPVTRRLRTIEPKVYEEGDQIYDPAYLIPVFYHSLGPDSLVKCQTFVEKHCLAYCLMALSTRCGLLRAVVYNCLSRFEQHLFSQRFYCKEQILTMFTLLKQSIKKSNLKLAPIVALFLSKLVDLFTHPESKIYRTITRFLLKQPYIDLVRIPLFGELFHSSSNEYKYERGWILNLLKHGIKDSIDYTLCTKAYVFKTLMTFYDCSLCDESTKMEILQVFYSTSKVQDMLMSLLFDYGFLLWLQMVIKHCMSESLLVVALIIENIGRRLSSIDNQVQLLEFNCLMILFIRRLNNESTIASAIADIIISILMRYPERLQAVKRSFIQIKHIVDRSTIGKNTLLLSSFS